MIQLLLGVVLGGWAVWRWRGQIERYIGELPTLREKAADAVDRGTEQVKERLHSAGEAIRGSGRSQIDFSERERGGRDR